MKISSLTDSQLEMVWRAAAPLQRVDQHSFLARVAELLTAEPELGGIAGAAIGTDDLERHGSGTCVRERRRGDGTISLYLIL